MFSYASTYYYICVRVLLFMRPHTTESHTPPGEGGGETEERTAEDVKVQAVVSVYVYNQCVCVCVIV